MRYKVAICYFDCCYNFDIPSQTLHCTKNDKLKHCCKAYYPPLDHFDSAKLYIRVDSNMTLGYCGSVIDVLDH